MKTKYFNYIAFALVVIWIMYNLYEGNNYDNEIEKNGITTVGKVTKFKGAGRRAYLRYQYYVNNNLFGSDAPRDEKGEKIGQFFKVIYSNKKPEVCRIYLDEKITDTTLILKAGFSKEDIANMPK
ncbi:hypothetical protein [Flavobacterium proteolyticum]|uniref:YxeA family protein n=1 Tax=Flavobacterium proteolyticum TaxID=2911683 RepID=A0ABR9WPP0_9FLAO|nr:hypothetical protein [Flavobacterium proteolyticum]MBE9575489.1 hypothetical protein [Flavobacterium proteolyticum]